MATTIKLKNGSGAPLAGDLVQGEPALDLTNKRLYTENASGTVIEVGTNPSTLTVDTDVLVVDATNNRVGIGTTSIATKLNIRSDASDDGILLEKTDGTDVARLFHDGVTTNARLDLFSGGSATVQIRANGDTHFSGGNVGIGTASPDGTFHVKDAIAQVYIQSNDGQPSQVVFGDVSDASGGMIEYTSSNEMTFKTNNLNERMRIDASGNVGIGTTEPEAPLTVKGASGAVGTHENQSWHYSTLLGDEFDLKLKQVVSAGLVKYTFDLRNSGDSYNNNLVLDRGKVGIGTASPSTYDSRTNNLVVGDSGDAGITIFSGATSNAYLQFAPSGDTGLNNGLIDYDNNNDSMAFATGGSERMRIDSSGNVGIGTTSPFSTARLQVKTGTNLNLAIQTGTTETSGMKINAFNDAATANIPLELNGSVTLLKTGETERMRIDASGNVGIGTTSPGSYYATELVIDCADEGGITLVGGTTEGQYLMFADGTSGNSQYRGFISYDHNIDDFTVNSRGTVRFQSGSLASEAMRLDTSGSLMVGTTVADGSGITLNTAGYIKTYRGTTTAASQILFSNPNGVVGQVQTSGTATSYLTSSDQRLKENIVDAPAGNIDAIRVRSFDWKADGSHQTYGMVAQELVDVAPEAVTQGQTEDDMWGVDYSKLVPMMIKEIQDLKAEVAALKGA